MMLLVHAAVTFFLCGVIWYVQLVQYPLFAAVGSEHFAAFHRKHLQLTTGIVAPTMCLELATAVLLVAAPESWTRSEAFASLGLVLAIWLTTFLLQVPQHRQLERAFDHAVVDALVQGNWIRTTLWTARALLCAVGVGRLVGAPLLPQDTP